MARRMVPAARKKARRIIAPGLSNPVQDIKRVRARSGLTPGVIMDTAPAMETAPDTAIAPDTANARVTGMVPVMAPVIGRIPAMGRVPAMGTAPVTVGGRVSLITRKRKDDWFDSNTRLAPGYFNYVWPCPFILLCVQKSRSVVCPSPIKFP